MSSSQDLVDVTLKRTVQVREQIRAALRRVALVLEINDQGLGAFFDAACKINRREIIIEELRALLTDMENTNADPIQEARRDVLAEARNETGGGLGLGGG
jgi:hypothetical protein